MCLKKKKIDDDKNLLLYGRFFDSNQNFTTKHVKIVQIPGFSRTSGKVATL